MKNKNTISDINELNDIEPNIKLALAYNNKELILETKNNDWYFDNIKQANKEMYLQTIQKYFNIDLDSLFLSINPNLLQNTLNSNTKQKDEIRTTMISIANSLTIDESIKYDVDKFNQLNQKINEYSNDKKDYNKQIKELQKEIEYYKNTNSEITNWEIADNNINNSKELYNIENAINNYNTIKNKIELLNAKHSDITNTINQIDYNINNIKNSNNYQSNNKSKGNIFLLIILFILGIIPGIIYYLIAFRKKENNDNSNTNISYKLNNLNKQKEELINQLSSIKKELDNLYNHKDYQNISLEELINLKQKYESLSNDNENNNRIKHKYNEMIDKYNQLINTYEDIDNKLNQLLNTKRKISENTNKILKQNFPYFDVDLFDAKDKEKLSIKVNNIPYENLNHSAKYNVAFNINEYLFNKHQLKTFVLIDNGESFNQVNLRHDTQVIIACVSNDNQLKLEKY